MTERAASIAFICFLLLLFFLAFIILLKIAIPAKVENTSYQISIGATSIIPKEGEINIDRAGHFIIQFRSIPSPIVLKQLAESGVTVGRYVGGNAYIAHASKAGIGDELREFRQVRSAVRITPEMRLQRELQNSPSYRKALSNDEPVSVDIRFHEGVSFARASSIIRDHGIESEYVQFLYGNRLVLQVPATKVQDFLECDEVDEIGLAAQTVHLSTVRAGKGINVDRILNNKRYHNPNGDGVLVSVTDAWIVDADHQELEDRVTIMHDTSGIDTTEYTGADFGHATAMAGTIASAGIVNQVTRGPAPKARILSLLYGYQPNNEVAYAAQKYGLRISHNAWSPNYDEEFLPPRRRNSVEPGALQTNLGYYGSFNFGLDKMIPEADVLSIWAMGNSAYSVAFFPLPNPHGLPYVVDAWHRQNSGYGTEALAANSKNNVSIGATMHDNVITGFSSRGPGYDGRLIPHLVAPGNNLTVIGINNSYSYGSGTSGSSAIAAGAAALLLQQYRAIHDAEPGSALMKAILINSALDLGPKGPDYTYGYGKLDSEYAAQTVSGQEGVREYKRLVSRFVEDTAEHKKIKTNIFRVPKGKKELRVTLVWHDPPGKKLINDLDLWVRYGKGKKIRPYTLNPNKPQEAAKRIRNFRDNTEHIVIENPDPGEWTVYVKGTRVPKGPQPYALVISAGKGNRQPVRKTEGDFTIERTFCSKGNINQREHVFNAGEDIEFHTLINVHSNARYDGGYYGTVTARYEFRDEDGVLRFVMTTSWEDIAPSAGGVLRDVRSRYQDIPDVEIIKGTYRMRSIITMHNGVSKTAANVWEVTIQ